ncbi:MAG: FAD-binding oxidoreductase [Bryobacteraceae bacterium]
MLNTESLRARLRGDLITPEDSAYESARKVYNGMIDRRPRLIVRCVDAADVMASVNFARDNTLQLAIRGGGHNGAGLGICDDGLVIDLVRMRGVHVDPSTRTVQVGGGCVWGDVDHATHAFGMAVPGGLVSTTGVAGLTLGGGLGHLTRQYGLTIDSLLAADIVLADGSFVTASADQHADLFWAIRGGGGNFGVVTSFEFRMHPVSTVFAGPMLWDLSFAAELTRFYDDFLKTAPEHLSGFFAFMKVPPVPPFPAELHLRTVAAIVWCYTGPMELAEAALDPFRKLAPPLADFTHAMPFPMLQTLFDPLLPPGLQWYWKADYFKDLSDEAIAEFVRYGSDPPTVLSTMHLYPIDGAAHKVRSEDTAWSYRDARYGMVIAGIDPDPANNDRMIRWARDYWNALHPHSAGGAYVNMMMEEGEDRIKAAYRGNYARLAAVKKQYDPGNLFHVNQNIKPAG